MTISTRTALNAHQVLAWMDEALPLITIDTFGNRLEAQAWVSLASALCSRSKNLPETDSVIIVREMLEERVALLLSRQFQSLLP